MQSANTQRSPLNRLGIVYPFILSPISYKQPKLSINKKKTCCGKAYVEYPHQKCDITLRLKAEYKTAKNLKCIITKKNIQHVF